MVSDELLDHLMRDPTDDGRLLVYADWLQQRGDPRADYARLQLELRTTDDRLGVLARLRDLYPVDEPVWVGRMELAGVFEPRLVEVPEMWWGVSLVARETTATYQGFPYQQQPPIPFDRFDGSFRWLREGPPERENSGVTEAWRLRVEALRGQGFRVPRVFERFMCDVDLWRRVPSCTANTFLVADEAELHPQPDGSAFLTFYTDSQSCVLWGLRLGRGDDRYAPVLAGAPEWVESVSAEPHLRFPELTFSAPTFEAFVYRWWIENSIWFATHLDDQRPLTDDEQAYVEHLRRVADVSG